jgi:hypothetical protein
MSGHKKTTITLSQEEYRKLHEAEMRLRFLNERDQEDILHVNNEVRQHLDAELFETRRRQEVLLDSLEDLNLNIQSIELQTCQSLIDYQAASQNEFIEQLESNQVNNVIMVGLLESTFHTRINNLYNQHAENLKLITQVIEEQNTIQADKNQLASEWIDAATILYEYINDTYDHQYFCPGSLDRAHLRLTQSHANLDQHLPEAAISLTQETYCNLSELRIDLEKLQQEYQILITRLNLLTDHAKRLFIDNKVVPAFDLHGNALPYYIDVDYWTNGEFTLLKSEFEATMTEITSATQRIQTSSLNHYITSYLPETESKISNLVLDARMNAINAQLRMNIAEIVVQALKGQGYSLDTADFISEDQRGSFQANLINLDGSRIVVQVDPVFGLDITNELNMYTTTVNERTAHERKQQALEIRHALQDIGLDVGTIVATRNPQNTELLFQHTIPDHHKSKTKRVVSSGKSITVDQ